MKNYNMTYKIMVLVLGFGLIFAVGVFAQDKTITGTVEENDNGEMILATDSGDEYQIEGLQMVDLVGGEVEVSSTLAEEGDNQEINEMSLEITDPHDDVYE